MKTITPWAFLSLIFLGACSISPKNAFLNAVKGKKAILILDSGRPTSLTFLEGGKTLIIVNNQTQTFMFDKAESPKKGFYKDSGGYSFALTVEGQQGGTIVIEGTDVIPFTFK